MIAGKTRNIVTRLLFLIATLIAIADRSWAAEGRETDAAKGQGTDWVRDLFAGFQSKTAKRLRLVDVKLVPGQAPPVVKAWAEYAYLDPQGKENTGKATLYLPDAVREGKNKVSLFQAAGYEIDDNMAMAHVRRGFAVVTPAQLEANPLARTINPDSALLHIARALPFVDDARVVIGGGSAGGYATLMLAAETFPLAAAVPDVPPVNLGYNAAFYLRQRELIRLPMKKGAPSPVPVVAVIVPIMDHCAKVYGPDTDERIWFQHSPLAHVNTITCPVSIVWSTADMLVPIDQVGDKWIRPMDSKSYPDGFTMDRAKLAKSREARLTLVDVLTDKDFEVFVVPEEDIRRAKPKEPLELAVSATKQWSITILDEGAPEPKVGHLKYPGLRYARDRFLKQVVSGKVAAAQLTAVKLERLMDRYAGKEWLPSKLKHLDLPESEKADVLRGLKTYLAASQENTKTFTALYSQLPADKQVLEPKVLQDLKP